MASLTEVKKGIQQLTKKQKDALLVWLQEEKEARWDEQIAKDAAAGKLDHLIAQAKAHMKAGRCRELP